MQEMKRIEGEVKSAIDPVTQPVSIDPASTPFEAPEDVSTPKPVSEAELEAQHASKLKKAATDSNQEV
jgi:hypothetical protein